MNSQPVPSDLISYTMRHKYQTTALVLARSPRGEMSATVALLTADLGLIRARVQGVRRPGARLAAALTTFAESEVILVRGRESWRVAGASLVQNWLPKLPRAARERAVRIIGFALRLIPMDTIDASFFPIVHETFTAFAREPETLGDAFECRAILCLLAALGLDAGQVPDPSEIVRSRSPIIARINRGIALSGL